jgi:hypothetical protein
MNTVVYEGFFIECPLKSSLEKDIADKHITTEFRPVKSHPELYGTKATFRIIGYGNDGTNEGYKVSLLSVCAPKEQEEQLRAIYDKVKVPHITLSVSANGKPVNTGKLDFSLPCEKKVVEAVFDGFFGN